MITVLRRDSLTGLDYAPRDRKIRAVIVGNSVICRSTSTGVRFSGNGGFCLIPLE